MEWNGTGTGLGAEVLHFISWANCADFYSDYAINTNWN